MQVWNYLILCLAIGASTDTNYGYQYDLPGTFSATASWELLSKAKKAADDNNINTVVGNIVTSDVFYHDNPDDWKRWG